jgi:hypothetical protein
MAEDTSWWNVASTYVDDNFTGTMANGGRFVWSVDGTRVRVYDSLEWEKLRVDAELELSVGTVKVTLPVFAEFELPSPCLHIVAGNDGCMVSSESKIFNISLNAVIEQGKEILSNILAPQPPTPGNDNGNFRFDFGIIEEIAIPESIIQSGAKILSNVHPFLGGLYMAASDLINDEMQMHIYKVADKLWSKVPIPVTKALEAIMGVFDDGESSILITNFNDASISVFDPDGTFEKTVKIDDGTGVNTGPYKITKNDANEVMVYSINGMVSKYDPIAEAITNEHNTVNALNGVVDDGTHLWGATSENLIRINKTDNSYKATKGPIDSCSIQQGAFGGNVDVEGNPDVSFKDVVLSKAQTYETKDGPITTKEHIITSTDDKTAVVENPKQPDSPTDDGFWRPVNSSLTGIGMISSGPHDYTGN